MNPAPDPDASRVANLDLIRAAAIVAVVLYHAGRLGVWPDALDRANPLDAGWAGVDLFFVLSGWLVGGLYWRERARTGRRPAGRFVARRLARTLPLYLAVLPIAYFAQRIFARSPRAFDPLYLALSQNYLAELPFFQVSWSLCVEEHFYLGLPLAAALLPSATLRDPAAGAGFGARIRGAVPHLALLGVAAGSFVARRFACEAGLRDPTYPYGLDATHLRLDGLALGVWLAFCRRFRPRAWGRIALAARLVAPAAVVLWAIAFLAPAAWHARWGIGLLSVGFAAVVALAADARDAIPSRHAFARGAIRRVAETSYAVYLTHPLAMNAYERTAIAAAPDAPGWVHLAPAIALVGAVGYFFHFAVERPALRARDRAFPDPRRDAPWKTPDSTSPPADAR